MRKEGKEKMDIKSVYLLCAGYRICLYGISVFMAGTFVFKDRSTTI